MSNEIIFHDECDELWVVRSNDDFMPQYKIIWLLNGEEKFKQNIRMTIALQPELNKEFGKLMAYVSKWKAKETTPLIEMDGGKLARGWGKPFYEMRLPEDV